MIFARLVGAIGAAGRALRRPGASTRATRAAAFMGCLLLFMGAMLELAWCWHDNLLTARPIFWGAPRVSRRFLRDLAAGPNRADAH